jgi:hypothetical protein
MNEQNFLEKPYSGTVVGIAVGFVIAILLIAGFVFGLDWTASWKAIGFPGSAVPRFYDFNAITKSAAECASSPQNLYPYIDAPCKPWEHFNYPPIWLLIGKLGINESHTVGLVLLFEIPALILIVMILRGRSIRAGLLSLAFVLSPSTVLAFERGNIDIIEWDLICIAALVFNEHRPIRAAITCALLALGVILKFLAGFCCILFIRFNKTAIVTSVVLILLSIGYVYSISDVMPVIRKATPVSPYISYGYLIIFDRLELLYAPYLRLNLTGLAKSYIPLAAVTLVLLGAAGIAFFRWRRGDTIALIALGSVGTAFLFGSAVYCATFLLATNYTYRLIFLILCLPQILDWIEAKGQADNCPRRIGYLLYGSAVISMWLKFHPEFTLHINQVTDWILFAVFTALLAFNAIDAFWDNSPKRLRRLFERIA